MIKHTAIPTYSPIKLDRKSKGSTVLFEISWIRYSSIIATKTIKIYNILNDFFLFLIKLWTKNPNIKYSRKWIILSMPKECIVPIKPFPGIRDSAKMKKIYMKMIFFLRKNFI